MMQRLLTILILSSWLFASADVVRGQDKTATNKGDNKKQTADKQDKQGVPGPEAQEEGGGSTDSLLQMILGSGTTGILFMVVLGLFSIVGASVAVERAFNTRRTKILPPDYVEQLTALVQQPTVQSEPFDELGQSSDSPVATIVQAGVERRGATLTEIEKAMEDAAARELAELRARMRPLTTVGAVAPLVGLLGTVVGMIIAFHTASQAGLGKAELLAKGIYMALITTAGGLAVAIPAMLLAAFFTGRVERLFREMDRLLAPVVNALVGLDGSPAARVATASANPLTSNGSSRKTVTTPAPTSEKTPAAQKSAPKPTAVPAAAKTAKATKPAEPEPQLAAEPVAAEQPSTEQKPPSTPGRQPPKRSGHNPLKI